MSNEATITVTLTVKEAWALRVASSFGGPLQLHPTHEPLEGARRKLREAEAATPDRPRKLAGHPLIWEGDDA